jgi:hypothetical protein
VADIFNEVDEEVRRERLKKFWDQYSIYIIALAVLIVVGVGGWRGYQYWEAKRSQEAGARFERAITLSEENKNAEAVEEFKAIAADAPGGYRTLARLRAAAALSETDAKAAVAAYDAITADTSLDQNFRDLAALRGGILLVDTAPFDDVRKRIEPLAEPGRVFRHTAREMLALSAWRNGDATAARRYVEMVSSDGETPQGVRGRMEMLSALLAGSSKAGS